MKDILRRIFAVLFPLVGVAIIGWYLSQNQIQVKEYVVQYQYIIIAIMALILLAFAFIFGILALPIKRMKLTASIMSLVVVIMGYYFFLDNPEASVYAGDILVVLGTVMFYLSLTGLLTTKKAREKYIESKQVIIEV